MCSTSLLHNITEMKRSQGGKHILYTVDDSYEYLASIANLRNDFHKIDLVDSEWKQIDDI